MIILGNIIWMLFGGIFTALYWLLAGCLFCITIIGIPFGLQAFKIAKLSLLPFGARVV
ncbi:MAG: YccF domain-containing protein [Collinsella phocaeensis]